MPSYSFVTLWHLDAPIDRVFPMIDDSLRWPSWWPSVLSVEQLEEGGPDLLGTVRRYTFRGRLPYSLAFDVTATKREPPHALTGSAAGELEGEGRWTLTENGGGTLVRYEWDVRTTIRWMDVFAVLPFVDSIFAFNHHGIMREGMGGLCRQLGVNGRYERADPPGRT
jgi:uncharacterized protein YndB with AHSA1/START domain